MPDDASVRKTPPKELIATATGATTRSTAASPLENSRPLDIHRWSQDPEADHAVELIAEQMRAQGSIKRVWDTHKRHLKLVILDLYAAWETDPTLYLGYSRNRDNYDGNSLYKSLGISFRPLVKMIVPALVKLGHIEHHTGRQGPTKGNGRQSRMRAEQSLIDLLEKEAGLKPEMLERDPNEEVIILKDGKGKDGKKRRIEYSETPETTILRTHVRIINDFLARHVIDLNLPDKDMTVLARKLKRDPNKCPIDFTRTRLRRVFNNSSFEQGGRFYGGWWQEIPKEYRGHVTINNKLTIEFDYSSLHPRMLYALEGINYPATSDPYIIPPYGKAMRDVVKRAFNILLNARNRASAVNAIRNIYPQHSKQIPTIIDAIKRFNKPIERHLHSGVGLTLQYLDSILVQEVVLFMIEQHGVMVLPVHDSFIVRTGYDDHLSRAMKGIFQGLFPGTKTEPVLTANKDLDTGTGEAQEVKLDLNLLLPRHGNKIRRNEWLWKRAERHKAKGLRTPIVHTKWDEQLKLPGW